MRLFKFIAFVAIMSGLFSLWQQRDGVLDAYRDDPEAIELRLDGLDIAFDKTPVGESPHALEIATDTRRIQLPVVERPPEPEEDDGPEIEIVGGRARMNGTVFGPDGPVVAATVRITRHTLDGDVIADVGTNAAGEWSASGLLGGRYSVRAFVPGLYTSGSPQLFLLESADKLALDVFMSPPPLGNDAVAAGPTHIVPGRPTFVAVTLGRWIVDVEGRLVRLPDPAVSLTATAFDPLSILSATDVVTDSGGAVSLVVECSEVGPAGINLSGTRDGTFYAVYAELPPCSFNPPAPPPGEDVDDEDEDEDDE